MALKPTGDITRSPKTDLQGCEIGFTHKYIDVCGFLKKSVNLKDKQSVSKS